jgi:hypothetical protein
MSDKLKKALVSIAINTAIYACGFATTLLEGFQDWWAISLVVGLKALQQMIARQTSTGGERPLTR